MKRLFFALFCVPLFIHAQNKPLTVAGTTPSLYLNHAVAPKENYYSVGRMYNISPREIAPFNNLELEKGLSLNQVIKIPLTAGNFLQSGDAGADEVLVPVNHIVKDKEGLFRIAANYKISLATLKQWNHLTKDAAANGASLIIGYLKVKKDLSPLASMAKAKPSDIVTAPVAETPKEIKPEPVKETPKEPVTETKPVVVKEEKKDPPAAVKKEEPKEQVRETEKPVVNKSAGKDFNGGYFRDEFNKQIKNNTPVSETGTGGTFKSSSGWEDGKYYCLHNNAATGSFVKITANGKSVYAKVLDIIPDIKQNSGLLIRLSNAAAAELGITDTKFECSITYIN